MNRKTLAYMAASLLCLVLVVSAASALDDLMFNEAKQKLVQQYSGTPAKPLVVSPFFYVGQLPYIVRAGDNLNIQVHGDMVKGQTWSIAIENGQFSTPGGSFLFRLSDVTVPADSEHASLVVSARPVSHLLYEYDEEGEVKSLESSSPDQNGRITLQAADQEIAGRLKESIIITGTPGGSTTAVNVLVSGQLAEDVSSPTIPFHIDQVHTGSFTFVFTVDGREKLRQTIFTM